MAVSGELLCSFELLKPLDSSALKSHIKKGRNMRNSMLNSPVGFEEFLARVENADQFRISPPKSRLKVSEDILLKGKGAHGRGMQSGRGLLVFSLPAEPCS